MSSPPRRLAAAAALALALAGAATTAQASTPPPGTPNLAKMTLQPTDLAPGAQVLLSAYFPPGSGLNLRAEYNRDFGAATTTGGVKLAQIQAQVTLADTPAFAKTVFAQLPGIYGGAAGRATLAQEVIPVTGAGSDATPKDAGFGKLRSVGVGQQSLFESMTLKSKGTTLAAGFVWLRVDGVLASLAVVATRPPVADSVSIALARTVAAHISAQLAATGS